jgi:hypothetical protein
MHFTNPNIVETNKYLQSSGFSPYKLNKTLKIDSVFVEANINNQTGRKLTQELNKNKNLSTSLTQLLWK